MAHRDDHEAARQRIDALERELEQTRKQAEAAERAAAPRGPAAAAASRPARRRPSAPLFSRPAWGGGGRRRYQRVVGAAALAYAPASFLTTFTGTTEPPFAAFGAALLVHLVIAYAAGHVCRAPFPINGAMALLIVSPLIGLGIFLGASDLLWGSVLSAGPVRWIVGTAIGIAVLAAGALISGSWSADAASSEGVDVG